MFGNSFFREFDDEPNQTWVASIAMLSDIQVRAGLKDLAAQNLQFPPNLSQFTAACKKPRRAAHWDAKDLPELTHDERQAEADKAWAQMEKLAGRKLPR